MSDGASPLLPLLSSSALAGMAVGLVASAGAITPGAAAAGGLSVVFGALAAATVFAARAHEARNAAAARGALPSRASGVGTDAGKRTPLPARVERPLLRDPLTGLYTAAFLADAIERDVRRVRRIRGSAAVVLADIDHFDSIARELGDEVAQDVMRQMGRFVEETIRDSDVAARQDDGFAILLTGADADGAVARMEELRYRLRELAPVQVNAVPLPLTMSFGIAAFPAHGESATDLIDAAEHALDAARRLGRNRVIAARSSR